MSIAIDRLSNNRKIVWQDALVKLFEVRSKCAENWTLNDKKKFFLQFCPLGEWSVFLWLFHFIIKTNRFAGLPSSSHWIILFNKRKSIFRFSDGRLSIALIFAISILIDKNRSAILKTLRSLEWMLPKYKCTKYENEPNNLRTNQLKVWTEWMLRTTNKPTKVRKHKIRKWTKRPTNQRMYEQAYATNYERTKVRNMKTNQTTYEPINQKYDLRPRTLYSSSYSDGKYRCSKVSISIDTAGPVIDKYRYWVR